MRRDLGRPGHRRRGVRRLGAAAALVFVAAGCWPAAGQGPDRRSHNPFETTLDAGNVGSLAEAWRADLGGTVGPPVLSNGAVHASDGNKVHGVDRRTGRPLWRFSDELSSAFEAADPIVDGDQVLFSGHHPGAGAWIPLAARLDARTGAVIDQDGWVVAARRGSRLLEWWAVGGATLPDGSVGYGYGLQVSDTAATGWWGMVQLLGEEPVRPDPTLGSRHVYLSGHAGVEPEVVTGVHAYPLTGPIESCHTWPPGDNTPTLACTTWSTATHSPAVTSPVLAEGEQVLYVVLADGTLLALAAGDGRELWRAPLGAAPSAEPALADGHLFVPLADGRLAVVPAGGCGVATSEATCAPAWAVPLGGPARQPAVANGLVYAGTDAGELVVAATGPCGAATCAPVAAIDVGGPVTGAPAVTGGRVYLGVGEDLVALAPSGP